MRAADLKRARARAERIEPDLYRLDDGRLDLHLLREPGAIRAIEQQIEALAVDPTLHEGLAEANAAVAQHARIRAIVAHLDVPGPAAIDGNISFSQEFAEKRFW